MITREQCRGCEDDFYNQGNNSMTGRCWAAESGSMVVRFRIGTWVRPDQPGAFTELTLPSCYSKKGAHFYPKLPDFVKNEDVIR